MKPHTISDILALHPCCTYTEPHLAKLFDGRETITLADVLDMPIPDRDKVWFATKTGMLTQPQLIEFLNRIVSRAVTNHVLNCGIPELERWAREWLNGNSTAAAAAYAADTPAAPSFAVRVATAAAAYAADTPIPPSGIARVAYYVAASNCSDAYSERAKQVEDLREITSTKRTTT